MTRRQALSFMAATGFFASWPSLARANSTAPMLILIELQGANDGLNTFIPYTDRNYYNLRPQIAIKRDDVLTVAPDMGFHFSLQNLARFYESGHCQIVQNLGYPNPVLSHFRSIELWEKGGDGNRNFKSGWMVEPLNQLFNNADVDARALHLDEAGGVFKGGLDGFLGPSAIGYTPMKAEARDSTVPVPDNTDIGLLGELLTTRQSNLEKIRTIQDKLDGSRRHFKFGRGSLGAQLSEVCSMISAGLTIPVYKVSIGSFDTHINQSNTHRDLLRELDEGIAGTVKALKDIGVWPNSLIMTYSEFGRRAGENGSRGTDHGMAAPHLLIGEKVNPGFTGHNPKLGQLHNNNLVYSIDYRGLYAHVLEHHFGLIDHPFISYRDPVFTPPA
ncbi:MAG: DUF1501 domain-containing protein [Alphaproteobacteria bacterium]|nr:DUF1501 domain-containing protein [Alphaproteobacteria bacterium]